MNKRIQELIKECKIETTTITHITDGPRKVLYGELKDIEKFAELIVKECLEQIDKMRDGLEADNEDQQALGADWAGLAVARHFGVE